MKNFSFLFLILSYCLIPKKQQEFNYYTFFGNTTGTNYTVVVEIKNFDANLKNFINKKIQEILQLVNESFSLYIENSKINVLNKNQKVHWTKEEISVF